MPKSKFAGIGIMLLILSALLVSCSSRTSATPTSSSGGIAPVQVTAKDNAFDPPTLNAKVGEKVTITLKNQDSVEHNFTISSLKVGKDIEKGETVTVTFTPTQAGAIQFFCKYHKVSNNMVGTLNVSSY